MALSAKIVTYTANLTTGNQDLTGAGFQPKAAIAWWARPNNTVNTFVGGTTHGIGAYDGTNQGTCTFMSEAGATTSDTARVDSNSNFIVTLNTLGTMETVDSLASATTILSDGIRINWSNVPSAQFKFHVLFLGGTDITNANVGSYVTNSTTGSNGVTGTGFAPDFLFFFGTGSNGAGTGAAHAALHVGATDGTNQWSQCIVTEDAAATSDTWMRYSHTNCVTIQSASTGVANYIASLTSMDSNGFTLNETTDSASTNRVYYLALKGGSYAVGNNTEPGSTGNQTVTTSKDCKAVMVFGVDTGTADSDQADCMFTMGVGTATEQVCAVTADLDNQSSAQITANRYETDSIYLNITPASNANLSTLDDEASLNSVSSTGFVLNWSNIGNARPFRFITFGDGAGTTPVSQSKTHKYNIIGKVTNSKTHKWNIIAVVTRSKTHKYNIFKIVSLTRTHKYNILQKITQSKTHKYNIIGKITRTRTHKYNIIGKITQSKTHKYNIIAKVTKTKTHLYNIIGKIIVTKTHKYSLLNTVSKSKTHLFSILNSVSKSKTHKYNILEAVIKAAVHVYNVIGLVTTTKTHKYNVIGKVVASKTHKYNIVTKVTTSKTHEYNILNTATISKTHKYNILQTATTTKTHLFNIIGYITKTKTHVYDVIGKITTTKTHKYNIIATITKSTTHKYNIISAIAAVSKTHKYNIESDTTVSTTKTHKFNILQKVTKSKTHIYNIVEAVSTIKTHVYNVIGKITSTKTHKYNVIAEVEAQKTHAFSVLEALSVTKTHIFNLIHSIALSATHKYNIIGKIVVNKTHIFDVDSAVTAVSTTKTHKFDISGAVTEVETTKTHLFSILNRITANKNHIFAIIAPAAASFTHKYAIIAKITATKNHKYNIISAITRLSIHVFNILEKVDTQTKTHRYNIVNLVGPRTRTHKYNVIGRITTTKTHRYGLGGKVSTQKTHRYQLGAIIFRELGGSTHALIRFPERITVIDILGDINNKVVANIEILPVINNRVIAVVQISEYPFNILTAETHKPRHRIASTLLIPPIIDKIENRAVAPYIGIQSIESTPESQIRLKSSLRLEQTTNPSFYVTSKTQIRQDEKSIIKVSGALSLKDKDRVVSTASIMIPPNLQLNKIIIPEIMSLEKEKTIKTIIKLLKTDDLFE